MYNLFKIVIGKSIANSVRRMVFNEMHKQHQPVLRERLGFDSIDEYMKASTDEILARQNS